MDEGKRAMPDRKRPKRTQEQVELAKQARKTPSVAEEIIWSIVRNRKLGFKFNREYPIGRYRIDFFCDEAKVGLEVDGEQHDPIQDKTRDAYLADLGILIFRIPNVEFFQIDPEAPYRDHIEELVKLCEQRSGRSRF